MERLFWKYFPFAILSVLFLPYLFPPSKVSHSYSYMVGFDNKIGFLILLIIAIPPLFYTYYKKTELSVFNSTPIERIPKEERYIKIYMSLTGLLIGLMGLIYTWDRFDGYYEGVYFYHFLYALDNGSSLYDEVQFIYGPLTIYPVYLLMQIGINIHIAYFFVLIVFQLLGLYFVYDILPLFKLSEKERFAIMLLITVISFPMSTGLNYCLFRFAIMPWAVTQLVLGYNRRNHVVCLLLALVLLLATLLYSPEIGLCYALVVTLWISIHFYYNHTKADVFTLISLWIGMIIIILLYPNYLSSVFQAGSGGGNFPYVPSLILCLIIAVFISYGALIGGQLRKLSENYDFIAIEVAMIIASPAGLGRCDPLHIESFCLFGLIVSYIILRSIFNAKVVKWTFLISILTLFPHHLLYNYEILNKMIDNVRVKVTSINPNQEKYESYIRTVENLNGTVSSIQCSNLVYKYLIDTYDYRETYFGFTPQWVGTKEGFDRELSELKNINADYLVVPANYEEKWLSPKYMGISNLLYCSYYFIKPYRYYHHELYGELIDYLNQSYHKIRTFKDITVLERN